MKRIVHVAFLAAALGLAQSVAAMPLGLRMAMWGGSPERAVEVAFDAAGGVVDGEWAAAPSLTATFCHEYGELPTASCDGYVFLGWTLNGARVEANDIVKTSKPHTLTASWGIRIGNGLWAETVCDEPITLGEPLVPPSGELVIPAAIAGRPIVGTTAEAFAGNADITRVTVPQCVCSSRLSLVFPASYQSISHVVIGADVERLAAGFFEGCDALDMLTFLSPDTSLGDNDLRRVGKLYDNQPDGYWVVQRSLVGYKGACPGAIPDLDALKRVMPGALEGCVALTDLAFTVESALEEIGANAFVRCTELRQMTLPPSLVAIGDEAFMGCSYLDNVIVPGSVKRVGDRAFKNCTGFTAAQIEYGVESLGEEAFWGDWRISEVDIPSTVAHIGANAFGGDSSIIRIGLRGDIRKASEIFSNCRNIREATVKAGEGAIVDGLFAGFASLKDVHFLGDCPALENEGRNLYSGTPSAGADALVTYVKGTSTGWDGTQGSHSLPQAWPLMGDHRRAIAIWDAPTYLCPFDSNGGTLGVQDTYQHSEERFVLPPEPVQTGYAFAGWWTQPVGGLPVNADTIFIEGVYTHVYAHWTKGHWVFLDPNGGTVVNDFVTYVEQTVYGVLPVPVRSGYAFRGWLYNGQKIEPDTAINESADHTLVAQWEANLYSVRYNANGGEGEMPDQDFVYGVNQTLRKNTFTCERHAFAGWATSEAGEVVYADGEAVSNLTAVADGWVELYAVWEETGVATPTVTPPDGSVFTGESCVVTIACATEGASLYYTTNGATPKKSSKYLYAGPFVVHDTVIVKAVAVKDGANSEYATATITKRTLTLADALDVGSAATVSTGGEAEWSPVPDATAVGGFSAQSGELDDEGASWVQVAVSGPGRLSFRCRTSCEHDEDGTCTWDRLEVWVDGHERTDWRMDGETGWTQRELLFAESGEHVVKWVYRKDESDYDGEDCAWLDEVVFSRASLPELPAEATPDEVQAAVAAFADAAVVEQVKTVETYNAFKAWVGEKNLAPQAVAEAPRAWASYVLGQPALLPEEIPEDALLVEDFEPDASAGDGAYALTFRLEDATLGEEAVAALLDTVFEVQGGTSPDALSGEDVETTFEIVDGKVRVKVSPKGDTLPGTFFYRIRLK